MGRAFCHPDSGGGGTGVKFEETPLSGVYVITPDKFPDERGFFARTFCEADFEKHGIAFHTIQCNASFNRSRGTLRGMHYQLAPYGEVKLVRCTAGKVYDVVVDLRPESSTYCQWYGLELSSEEHNALLIPEGLAHGYLSLTENTEVFYQMASYYAPDSARGVRWDDPAFGIDWPFTPVVMAERDAQWTDYSR
jgi:dTDP-4-dehydrorhamnose 3,5-epimerase